MEYKIIYFTRTNDCKRIAEKIADKISIQAIQVTDGIDWNGDLGFIKGGYYASKGKESRNKIGPRFRKL